MPERIKIEVAQIDPTILDRISEQDVRMWLAAKLAAVRAEGILAHNIEPQVWFRSYYGGKETHYDYSVDMHAAGHCALTHRSVQSAVNELRELVLDNPTERAAKKREEARAALAAAEQIEAAAKAAKGGAL